METRLQRIYLKCCDTKNTSIYATSTHSLLLFYHTLIKILKNMFIDYIYITFISCLILNFHFNDTTQNSKHSTLTPSLKLQLCLNTSVSNFKQHASASINIHFSSLPQKRHFGSFTPTCCQRTLYVQFDRSRWIVCPWRETHLHTKILIRSKNGVSKNILVGKAPHRNISSVLCKGHFKSSKIYK